VLVLRYWEQLTDSETAAVLGCPESTVRSVAWRGLARLRQLADDWNDTGRSDNTVALYGRNGRHA
jgi:DNA-directed RNA polymerase specialized sigma24 family protein